tara:strand:- start:773 stop:1351 length:579 start_codon:yes stop_codon:yes gene_type:complete
MTKKTHYIQKLLGDLGEKAVEKLLVCGKNLNAVKNNFPMFDVLNKGKEFYSVKTRSKYSTRGLNSQYNFMRRGVSVQKFECFNKQAKNYLNFIPRMEDLFWCTIPYEKDKWCPVYYGKITELPDTHKLNDGLPVFIGVKMTEQHTKNYDILGYTKIDLENMSVDCQPISAPLEKDTLGGGLYDQRVLVGIGA